MPALSAKAWSIAPARLILCPVLTRARYGAARTSRSSITTSRPMSALPVLDAYEDPVRSPARPCRLSDPAPSQHLSFRRERDILSACSRPRLLAASSDRTDEPRCPTCCMPPPSALDAVSLRVLGLFFLWTNRSPVCGSFRHPCIVLCAPCMLFSAFARRLQASCSSYLSRTLFQLLAGRFRASVVAPRNHGPSVSLCRQTTPHAA